MKAPNSCVPCLSDFWVNIQWSDMWL